MSNQIEPGNLHGAKKWARETLGRGLVQPPIEYCDAAAEVIQSLPDTVVDGDKLREVIADWGNREVTSDAYTLYRQVLSLLPALPKKTMEGVEWDGREHHLAEAVADWIDVEPYEVVMIEPGSGASNIKVWNPRENEYRNVDSSALILTGRKYKFTPDSSEEIVKVIRHEKESCLDNQDYFMATLWRSMERAAGEGEWEDLLNSIRELKLPKNSDSTSVNGAVTNDSEEGEEMTRTATVVLFRESGKYYTEESWRVPEDAIGPHDMERSPDFRRIGHGAVLVASEGEHGKDENWGYPYLLNNEERKGTDELSQFIREVDGDHTMGAGELAEKIIEWLSEGKTETAETAGATLIYTLEVETKWEGSSLEGVWTNHNQALSAYRDCVPKLSDLEEAVLREWVNNEGTVVKRSWEE